MKNYLVVSALTPRGSGAVQLLTGKVLETGCNLVECRATSLGAESGALLLVGGSWDGIAKLEAALPRLAEEHGWTLSHRRTERESLSGEHIPYAVDSVSADRPGIVHNMLDFFAVRGVIVDQLTCSRYQATQTGAPMFSGHFALMVPIDLHVATLRDEFMEFCDRLNLDAILEPVKN